MGTSLGTLFRSLFGGGRARPSDGDAPIDWDVTPLPERVVAVGDLHGDVQALGAILRACRLIDEAGRWAGDRTHLVLMGDLMGGNGGSRLLLDSVLRLEDEAGRAGGRVHALLGNHDILPVAGRFGKMTRGERDLFTAYPVPGAPGPGLADAFRGNSTYARWLRRRPALLKIGSTLFVHAGVERWARETDPAAVNSAVRAWIAYWQGVGPRPRKSSRWTSRDGVAGGMARSGRVRNPSDPARSSRAAGSFA
jgi:hypothetical protein